MSNDTYILSDTDIQQINFFLERIAERLNKLEGAGGTSIFTLDKGAIQHKDSNGTVIHQIGNYDD